MADLLQVMPEYVLHWMVQRGKERQLQQKEVIIKEGEKCNSLFLVLDGLFDVQSGGTDQRHIERVAPGNILGEISFFTDGVASSTVIAEEPSLVLEVSRKVLHDKLAYDHEYAADLYKAVLTSLSARFRQITSKLYTTQVSIEAARQRDARVNQAQEEIDQFKRLMTQLDKEGIKGGGISEESFQKFMAQARVLMKELHSTLGDESSLSEPVRQQLGARLQHEMLPYLLTTSTAERFYSKPRGYAGDYLAIQQIYENSPAGTGRLGPVVDRMFLEMPPALAVRNRRKLFAEEILNSVQGKPEGPVRVLCMASGPATEVFDAYAQLPDRSRLKVTLLDIDLQALAYVDEIRARQKLSGLMTLVNENIIALFLGRGKLTLEPQNLIYSTGLIDYLNDKLVAKLLQYSYENLLPGGRVILGNFHPNNPAKEFMDYVLEWNLIHRTEEDMNRLFIASPFKRPASKIQFEKEGVDLFAECVKDQAHDD